MFFKFSLANKVVILVWDSKGNLTLLKFNIYFNIFNRKQEMSIWQYLIEKKHGQMKAAGDITDHHDSNHHP